MSDLIENLEIDPDKHPIINLTKIKQSIKNCLNGDIDYIGCEKTFNRISQDIKSELAHLNLADDVESMIRNKTKFISKLEEEIKTIDEEILKLIQDKEKSQEDFNYVKSVGFAKDDTTWELSLRIDDEVLKTLEVIIANSSEWKYPSLEIGSGEGHMTPFMVSADPLYVTDLFPENLQKVKNLFNQTYSKRIRCYVNRGKLHEFNFLPQNQFKFILAWNVFNFYPKKELIEVLSSCWSLLRPGGRMMFSYCDCDFIHSIKLWSITPSGWYTEPIMTKILSDIGFDIESFNHAEEHIHWVEIKKPGELSSSKIHNIPPKISFR